MKCLGKCLVYVKTYFWLKISYSAKSCVVVKIKRQVFQKKAKQNNEKLYIGLLYTVVNNYLNNKKSR